MLECSYWGRFTEWDFPTCLCGNQRQSVKEWKTGGWNDRKGQSGSERTKEQAQLETERLRDWNTNIVRRKKEREIDNEGYLPFIWVSDCVQCFLFLMCSTYFPSEFLRSLVWSIIVSLPSHNISFGAEYSNTWVKLTGNKDRNLPIFNT